MAMGDGRWQVKWIRMVSWSAQRMPLALSLSQRDCLNCCCCGWGCCCIVFALRFALLIRRFRSLHFFFLFFSLIIEPRCVCRNLPMIFIFIQRWSCKFEPNGRKTNAFTNRRWLMIRPSAHCTTLQQPTNIHTLAIYVCTYVFKSWTPFVILLCLARLHNNYYSSIFHQLFILFLGWFCIALLTLKIKKIRKKSINKRQIVKLLTQPHPASIY